jgi:hypothetical protein
VIEASAKNSKGVQEAFEKLTFTLIEREYIYHLNIKLLGRKKFQIQLKSIR